MREMEERVAEERGRSGRIQRVVEGLEVEMNQLRMDEKKREAREGRIEELEGELRAAREGAGDAVGLKAEVRRLQQERDALVHSRRDEVRRLQEERDALSAAAKVSQAEAEGRIHSCERALQESRSTAASLRSSLASVREELQRAQAGEKSQKERGERADGEVAELKGRVAALEGVNDRHSEEAERVRGRFLETISIIAAALARPLPNKVLTVQMVFNGRNHKLA
jgi:chromosome segregation ATPase